MDRVGIFEVPVIVAHAVYATDEDIRLMAEKKVSVAINPRSNMKLGNGFAPVDKFLRAGSTSAWERMAAAATTP